jgi:tRNA (cytidine32/uridine32-2'-O)-methyltransferase
MSKINNLQNNIKIILIETSHPGNIGAVARAMKTMNLTRLCLVRPKIFPHVEATARAAGADDLLAKAIITDSLDDAIKNAKLVVGTSARLRTMPIPLLSSREAAKIIIEEADNNEVAILFGRENNGLNNEELGKCHYHINIPANEDFSSLNIAAAAQIISYEIKMASGIIAEENLSKNIPFDGLATIEDMERFYVHLEKVLTDMEFLRIDKSTYLMSRLRRLFNRARPEKLEINILRGILTAIQKCK